VPLWQEHRVIGGMLDRNLGATHAAENTTFLLALIPTIR
jgi:hypothetical protein